MKIILDLSLKDIELISQGLNVLLSANGDEKISLNKSYQESEISKDEYKSRFRVLERRGDKLSHLIFKLWK